ncbi:MAG: hypothetical protein K5639_06930 [Eubacterium sp.]|nr:hypothetical protein [Eubacterium sp.]
MKREGYLFYFIVDSEDKNMTLNDKAIQETMDIVASDTLISLYTTIAGSNTRDSLFMKKEFQDNDLDSTMIIFVNKDLETIFIGNSYVKKIYDIIKENNTSVDMAEIIRNFLKNNGF